MDRILEIILYTTLAGAAIPIGGAIAAVERVRPRWLEQELRYGVIAFGGGVLLSAVALVLVPEGMNRISLVWGSVAMLAGGLTFLALDEALQKAGGSVAQLAAMLADFVPEATALGASLAAGSGGMALLLAILIAMQNLPEGFNAYREMLSSGMKRSTLLIVLAAMVPLGPAAGLGGYWLLSGLPAVLGGIMLFSAGGILYLTFQDLAPQAKLEQRWGPALGAVLGFLAGMIGHQLIQ